ncbi:MAG: STAS/SEC14 domain-containing protein [Cyanobacteria bacterium]|nr:STAS/SEC14 domain-containing protein [Cyanobacteria bacterium CG_2015-16_32_12]NCO77765.1 STAS/SEC14 domain-containing protein [Cyanobacteria bacterium CG_2015-22_32_23]NCQ03417.1 STAS/SEC14 domain-containing protein [Cyanobacteria bacterium CG_2015-09_32_10]NCQ41717.1 STAS/SEC14 domain-containing protein [Cyanobacteria bacterium CG_2015-04_32_10]NCS83388.1 STAS/SEC14 domain-containing protein [Cyanobacteria bacterium CG_2015-02_32_10]
MPKIKLEAQLSQEDLFQAVKQLTMTELEEFTQNVIAFRAKQITPNLSKKEANLLLKINQDVDDKIKQSYEILIKKKEAENLTENEYQELLNLTDIFEKYQWKRLKNLTELATLRQCSLSHLIEDLGIKPTNNEGL